MGNKKPKVIVNGALGKMGTNAVETFINNSDKFELKAGCIRDLNSLDKDLKAEIEAKYQRHNIDFIDNLESYIKANSDIDILVELTNPSCVFKNSKLALENNIRPVIGATGLTEAQIEELSSLAKAKGIGAIIAPNFAIGLSL